MATLLITLAVLAPLTAAGAVATGRLPVLLAGRIAATACGFGALLAVGLAILSGLDDDGRIGDIPLVDIGIDRANSLLLIAVLGTGAVVAAFSRRSLDDEARASTYFARVLLVVVGSSLVVLPGGPIPLAVGWIVSSQALTGLLDWRTDWAAAVDARRRVRSTLLVGDVSLIGALVLLAGVGASGVTRGDASAFGDLLESSVLGIGTVHLVALLVVVAGASRSALFPFHRWLIGTLVAPTPVSALVHAGFVSGAGLLLIRFAAPFVASDVAVVIAFTLGVVTIVVGGTASSMRSDVKGSLAWSTVAQMAFMVVQCAVGAFSSAVFHIIGHGMYKAALFLGAGGAVSQDLRDSRRPARIEIDPTVRRLAVAVIPTALIALGFWLLAPEVGGAGRVLIAVFAWLSTASALHGWLERAPLSTPSSLVTGTLGGAVAVGAYLGGLRLVERFVEPSFGAGHIDTAIGPWTLVVTIAVVAVSIVMVSSRSGPAAVDLRSRVQTFVEGIVTVGARATLAPRPAAPGAEPTHADAADAATRAAQIRADVARAGRIVAPMWPLTSFVAVNPLGGLEASGFDVASTTARRWLRGRTHLSLGEYRSDLERGLVDETDLAESVHTHFMELCADPPVSAGRAEIDIASVIMFDLLHGPEAPPSPMAPRTALERRGQTGRDRRRIVDTVLTGWIASFVSPPTWAPATRDLGFIEMCRRRAMRDARLRSLVSTEAAAWIRGLDTDAGRIIDRSFAISGVTDLQRIDELRGLLACLPGWAGHAKWRNEWAQPDDGRPVITLAEIAAVSALLEAAIITSTSDNATDHESPVPDDGGEHLDARVDAAVAGLGLDTDELARAAVHSVLGAVTDADRAGAWLSAEESNFDRRMLATLDRAPRPSGTAPSSQIAFCIDVRSEGFRRHLEDQGADATIGFAGFFGVPMRVREVGWDHAETRCPVLVAPGVDAIETPDPSTVVPLAARLRRQRIGGGIGRANLESKHVFGAPFVAAETLGWLLGPLAAMRTFASRPTSRPERIATDLKFDDEVLPDQRLFLAESVLNTMGLIGDFAPLVVLAGHTSVTTNNAHATSLECGACAGAPGDSNARAVAALLNSTDVRLGLADRGIEIPDETWFLAALHDTVTDVVELLDIHHAPASHHRGIDELRTRLAVAGERQSRDRSRHLPGPDSKVRARGSDWAQVRPEWGLARNAAFIIGPRSMTAGLDLAGRAFLHTYDHRHDPSGKVLQTIMTAPLVVGHWIASQYYFSTVDPEVFGAGDKLLHNPLGSIGVVAGDGGDLRVGLPSQSTHIDGHRHHQPLRMLAVIEAEIVRVEEIIRSNPILETLTSGSWMRIAARSDATDTWSLRTPGGTWVGVPSPFVTGSDSPASRPATLTLETI